MGPSRDLTQAESVELGRRGMSSEAVGPALRIHEIEPLDQADSEVELIWRFSTYLVLIASGIALFLSLPGIYAVMAFAVARRTREIGVRVALGGNTSRVLHEIFRKPLEQIGTGVLLGCASMGILAWVLTDGRLAARDGTLLLALGVGLLAVCSLACVAPARRALRVEPAEALSAEE